MDNIKVLKLILEDIPNDVKEMEGKPFTGRNVAEAFGKQAAIIEALAKILLNFFDEKEANDR